MNTQIVTALKWRFATKLFNPDRSVCGSDLETLLEAVRLAPSSLGLQPWKVYVIANKDIKEKLKVAAWNQPQLTDASHIIVFATRKNIDESYINLYLEEVMKVRKQTKEDIAGYRKMIVSSTLGKTQEQLKAWNDRQVYIALGILLESAALLKIDACPMEGFDSNQFDEILGLNKTEYSSIVIAAVGYRSEKDTYAFAPKVRFEKERLISQL